MPANPRFPGDPALGECHGSSDCSAGYIVEVRDGAFLLRTAEGDTWLKVQVTVERNGHHARLVCDLASRVALEVAPPG